MPWMEAHSLVEGRRPADQLHPVGWILPQTLHPRMENLLWVGVEARRVKGLAGRRHKHKGG